MKSVSTEKPIEILNSLWQNITPAQKKTLLKSRGLHQSWAETKTIHEMVSRGGGMAANSLLDLTRAYAKKNPQIKTINFNR